MAERPDTQVLVALAKAGDQRAANTLLGRHRARLRRLFRVRMDPRLATRLDPSDIVQETLLIAARRLPEYLRTEPMPFYAWLRRLGWERMLQLNRTHIHSRKRSIRSERRDCLPLPDPSSRRLVTRLLSTESEPSDAAIREERKQQVRAALCRLAARDREILVLRYLEQLSTKEIAAVLNLTDSAVKVRHFRAVKRIRDMLDSS